MKLPAILASFVVALLFLGLACEVQRGENQAETGFQVGSCVILSKAQGELHAVDCAGPHEGQVTNVRALEGDEYPGDEAVAQEVKATCPPISTALFPNEATWGDPHQPRQIVCILEEWASVQVGDCVAYSDMLEHVSCQGPHDAEVIGVFDIDIQDASYPGDGVLSDYALKKCPQADTRLYPTEDSWVRGDRRVTCFGE